MTRNDRVAVLGAGMLGEALLSGFLAAGTPAGDLVITEKVPERAAVLADKYGVAAVDNVEAAEQASVLLVAVKPQDVPGVLDAIAPKLGTGQLVVSLAAGVLLSTIERALPDRTPAIRVMSNTPVRVGEAMSALAAGRHATEEHLVRTETLLSAVGRTVRVSESQLDAVTALSGSGPAYFFYLVEAMIDAGVLLGLPRDVATELIVQTAYGSAAMLRISGEHPVALREAVTSPGGTTISAIRELERHGVRAAMLAALQAAADRSAELGRS